MKPHWKSRNVRPVWTGLAVSLAVCLAAAACASSSAGISAGSSSSGSSASGPVSISVSQFNRTLSAMTVLKPLAAAGKGDVAAILPDTVSSARYAEFDAPDLTQALTKAGLSSSQFSVQNAQGSDATELSDAQTAITKDASVLIVDPLDSGVGAQIESYAKSHGVAVIDYDRLTVGGSRSYYVSFNNVQVSTAYGAAWSRASARCYYGAGSSPTEIARCGLMDIANLDGGGFLLAAMRGGG